MSDGVVGRGEDGVRHNTMFEQGKLGLSHLLIISVVLEFISSALFDSRHHQETFNRVLLGAPRTEAQDHPEH